MRWTMLSLSFSKCSGVLSLVLALFLSFSLQGGPLALALLRLGPLFYMCF